MPENLYIITFITTNPMVVKATSPKELLIKIYNYISGNNINTMFEHALNGMTSDKESIELYNYFVYDDYMIKNIYKISEEIGLDPDESIATDI